MTALRLALGLLALVPLAGLLLPMFWLAVALDLLGWVFHWPAAMISAAHVGGFAVSTVDRAGRLLRVWP